MNVDQARFNMVEQQVRPWEVLDQTVLDAMMTIPREHFVPDEFRLLAFSDTRIPLAHRQLMLAPRWEGRILQAMVPSKSDRVLLIGTGSGYLTALFAHLAQSVLCVDVFEDFVAAAIRKFRMAGLTNITTEIGDACNGWPQGGPYNIVVATAASPSRRNALEQQLMVSGRLFIVVGASPAMEALVITRTGHTTFEVESLFELDMELLIGAEQKPQFEF